ncbi:MAG: GvpL/GvpF family gas vesicle protein [Pseudomonadota bacterium]
MLILHGVVAGADRARLEAALFEPGPGVAPAAPIAPIAPGARWRVLEVGALALLASEIPYDPAAFAQLLETEEAASALAAAHNRVLSTLISHIDLLPARLAGGFESAEGLVADAASRQDGLLAGLARIAGAAEYTVRLSARSGARAPATADAAPPSSEAPGGRGYLQGRLSQRRRGAQRRQAVQELGDALQRAAAAISREVVFSHGPTDRRPELRLELALLLARAAEPRLAALGAEFGPLADRAGLELTLIGPWAPFSFADAPDPQAEAAAHSAEEAALKAEIGAMGAPAAVAGVRR